MSDSATPWTAAHQAPPSMGFSRQEYWSGVPLPSPATPYPSANNYHACQATSPREQTLAQENADCLLVRCDFVVKWILLAGQLEKAMALHSSTLAWKIPWTEEPGRLQSMGSQESDTTERLHFHFSLSCIGEGNGNPLQCSCLENPSDGAAWWAAIYGASQSRTRLKPLSSSSRMARLNTGSPV